MIKLETKTAVYTGCNNGSSSIVTKDGELYMFGKDAIYSDSTCKLTGTFKNATILGAFLRNTVLRIINLFVYKYLSVWNPLFPLHRPGDRPERSLCNSGRHGKSPYGCLDQEWGSVDIWCEQQGPMWQRHWSYEPDRERWEHVKNNYTLQYTVYCILHICILTLWYVHSPALPVGVYTLCSIWCGEHGHSHGWRPGGWAGGEGGEEYDVPARHAQVEVGPMHGLHSVWRLHWLWCQLCQQWSARQSTRRVRRHTHTHTHVVESKMFIWHEDNLKSFLQISICGCGSGESGCSACGCCKACARELDGQEARQRGIFDAVKEMIPLDLLLGRTAF